MTSVMVGDVEVVIHDRSEWQLSRNPVTGPATDLDDITTDVGHWPGILGGWIPPTDTASWLRWTQDIYKQGRGYSIGYGFCQGINPPVWIGPRKVVLDAWIVRGLDYRNAANNGDFGRYEHINWNANTISVIALCSPGRPIDADMIESMRWLLAAIDVMLGRGPRPMQGHRDSDWTSCCGDDMYGRLPEIAARPNPPKPKPTPKPPALEEDEMQPFILKFRNAPCEFICWGHSKTRLRGENDRGYWQWKLREWGLDDSVQVEHHGKARITGRVDNAPAWWYLKYNRYGAKRLSRKKG